MDRCGAPNLNSERNRLPQPGRRGEWYVHAYSAMAVPSGVAYHCKFWLPCCPAAAAPGYLFPSQCACALRSERGCGTLAPLLLAQWSRPHLMAPWAINTHFLLPLLAPHLGTLLALLPCCLGLAVFWCGSISLWLRLYRSRQFRTVCNSTRRMINYNRLYLRLYLSSDVSAELSSANFIFLFIFSAELSSANLYYISILYFCFQIDHMDPRAEMAPRLSNRSHGSPSGNGTETCSSYSIILSLLLLFFFFLIY